MKRTTTLAFLALVAFFVAGCASDGDDSTPPADTAGSSAEIDDDHDADEHSDEYAFGGPAQASEATRTVDISLNEFSFAPESIEVADGEVVTFRLHNEGAVEHDFTIGDDATQDAHEIEMAEMSDAGHGDPNAITVQAGETVELTWRFEHIEGQLRFGCHIPGHYAAGMVGDFILG